jgi:hypothetical protein
LGVCRNADDLALQKNCYKIQRENRMIEFTTILAESSTEGYGSKTAYLSMMKMMMMMMH